MKERYISLRATRGLKILAKRLVEHESKKAKYPLTVSAVIRRLLHDRAKELLIVATIIITQGCAVGPSQSCAVVLGREIPSIGKCPYNSVMTGFDGTYVNCQELSVSCPVANLPQQERKDGARLP